MSVKTHAIAEDILPRSVRWWALPTLLGVGVGAALFPFDGPLGDAARALGADLGGDLRRELAFIGQFGAITSLIIVAWAVWALDPARRRRLPELAIAAVGASVGCLFLKMLIGRPRPKFDDPGVLLGPWGAYPIDPEVGVRHAWEIGSGISSDLWAMPSSHTAAAVALSAILIGWYPRLRALAVTLAVLVALSRLLFGAHYPSDLAVGAAVGWIAGAGALRLHRAGPRTGEVSSSDDGPSKAGSDGDENGQRD